MDRLPPMSAIRAFEAAGRHENFSRAADELGLTQAAISYQVRQLEDRVGRPLFVREKGRVRLSESGRRLLPALTSGFSGIAEAFAALREEDEDVLTSTPRFRWAEPGSAPGSAASRSATPISRCAFRSTTS